MKPGMATSDHDHLQKLLQAFPTAMLVTRSPTGVLRSRPMMVIRRQNDPSLWFAARFDSAQVAELVQDPQVNVAFHRKDASVSVSGKAALVHDRLIVRELWQDTWRLWFPDGPEEMELVLVQVTPSTAEYWDLSGAKGLRFIVNGALALLRGDEPKPVEGAHAVVDEARVVAADQTATATHN